MSNFLEDNPFFCIIALIGLTIGLLMPSPMQDFLSSNPLENVAEDPVGTLTGYVVAMPIVMVGEIFTRIISGLMGGIIGMLVGGIIEFARSKDNSNDGGYY